jgi:hypothetical protein
MKFYIRCKYYSVVTYFMRVSVVLNTIFRINRIDTEAEYYRGMIKNRIFFAEIFLFL